jgi:hypothetical protein
MPLAQITSWAWLRNRTDQPPRFSPKAASALGWAAVVLVTVAACFWSFWGTIEAFHEGWWQPHSGMRLLQLLAYMSPAIVFCGLAFAGIRWPRVGGAMFALVGAVIATLILIDRAAFSLDILLCLNAMPIVVGLLFWFGRPNPRVSAYAVSLGLPLVIMIVCGIEPVYRVSTRFDDGDRGARLSKTMKSPCSGRQRGPAGVATAMSPGLMRKTACAT